MPELTRPFDNFCIAPWVNLHVNVHEKVQPCCFGAGVSYELAQLPMYLGSDNQKLQTVKQYFKTNVTPPDCQGCQEKDWYSQFSHQTPTDINDFTLLSIDLRWSSTCQLTCLYCNENQSSAWANLKKHQTIVPIARRIKDRDICIDVIEQHRSTIQRVSLLGGEPLLIKENLKVLDLLSPEVQVDIFTGFNVDLDSNPVYQRLIDMPNVYWIISMENVGKKFEFVRRNASWSKQVKNIETLLANSRSKHPPTLQSQFSVYSATSIKELYDFAANHDIHVNWNWLQQPVVLNFDFFPDRYKSRALEQLHNVKLSTGLTSVPVVDHIIDRLMDTWGQGSDDHVAKCIKWHQKIESDYFKNKLDFSALWPEFSV